MKKTNTIINYIFYAVNLIFLIINLAYFSKIYPSRIDYILLPRTAKADILSVQFTFFVISGGVFGIIRALIGKVKSKEECERKYSSAELVFWIIYLAGFVVCTYLSKSIYGADPEVERYAGATDVVFLLIYFASHKFIGIFVGKKEVEE